jgi:tagaturonate epimerase
MKLEKFSMGVGDRFAHQGEAQLNAMKKAKDLGIDVVPVWNKSHREHTTIGTSPCDVRKEANSAVKQLGWDKGYYVDADHIGLTNVELFIESSDFFTLDVADFTGEKADDCEIRKFVDKYKYLAGTLELPGIKEPLQITEEIIANIAKKYLLAVKEAAKIYRKVEAVKGTGNFVTEVSMDETDDPQTPLEMLFILAAIADEGIPAQTIAPKFTGRFNKGVDYVGDVAKFAQEFEEDIAVIAYAIEEFNLPDNIKLSVHSGSDKFSIYGPIKEILQKYDAGLHLKTAGTTWLEEVIGLAEAEGDGLEMAKKIYEKALGKFDELCAPYATVIDIEKERLPSLETVNAWSGEEYAAALCHDQSCENFNADFRQLVHVGYKIAAQMGETYTDMLDKYKEIIAQNVEENILERHIKRIFPVT